MKSKSIFLLVLNGSLFAHTHEACANPPGQSRSEFELQSIHMIDRSNGWAQTVDRLFATNSWEFPQQLILRTADGGVSWKTMLTVEPELSLGTCFRDSKSVWVAIAAYEGTNVTIFHTSDGGRSWSRSGLSQIRQISDISLSFPDAHSGWLVVNSVFTMNSSSANLYETEDGGATWQSVNTTDRNIFSFDESWTKAKFFAQQPFFFSAGSITFQNASIGWVWGYLESTGPRFLFMTKDAGRNWQVQELPLGSEFHGGRMEPLGIPQFFPPNNKDGVLPAQFVQTNVSTNSFTAIYNTHDGGITWQATTPINFCGAWNFTSANDGWVWSPEPHGSTSTSPVKGDLYRIKDGGKSWTQVQSKIGLNQYLIQGQNIIQLDFVDGQYGWAIARDGHNFTQLLHTADAGNTWNSIQIKLQ